MPNPFFTVITVTYNSSQFVRDAIESVLASTFTDFELIIGDDCSTDNTWDIINEYNDPRIVKYRNDKNLREYPNRNKALGLARGEWVIFIDGDDVIYSHGLKCYAEFIEQFDDVSMIIQKNYHNNIIWPIKLEPKQFLINEFFGDIRLSSSSFASNVFRLSSIKEIGGLNTNFKTGDEDLRLRMGSNYTTLFIAGWFSWPRETPGQASSNISPALSIIERHHQIRNLLTHFNGDNEISDIVFSGLQKFLTASRNVLISLAKNRRIVEIKQIIKYFGLKIFILTPRYNKLFCDEITTQSPQLPFKWKN